MLTLDVDTIEARARALADRLVAAGWNVALVSGTSAVGGGSAPGVALPTVLVALDREGLTADALEARLRGLPTPVIARIVDDRVVLDLRTIPPEWTSTLRKRQGSPRCSSFSDPHSPPVFHHQPDGRATLEPLPVGVLR